MLKGPTPYQILQTNLTGKQRYEVCCSEEAKMTGQELQTQIQSTCRKEEPVFLSELYRVTQETIWTHLRSFIWKLGKVYTFSVP